MKKMLSVFILLAVVFASACQYGQGSNTLEVPFDLLTYGNSLTVVENEGMNLTLMSVKKSDSSHAEITFEFDNKSEHRYKIVIIPVRVNNTALYIGEFNFYIEPNPLNNISELKIPIIWDYLYADNSKESFHTFNFMYVIEDRNLYQTEYSDIVTISGGELQESMQMPQKYLIGSDEYFDLYFAGAAIINFEKSYSIIFYNKTDETLYFNLKSLAINNYSLPTRYMLKVEPKTYFYYSENHLSFGSYNGLTFYGLSSVATIEVDFRCYADDAKTLLSSIKSKLVLDDSIVLDSQPFGNIIYNQNNIIISVKKYIVYKEELQSNVMVLIWQVQNNENEPVYMNIQDISITNINGDSYDGALIPFSVLPGTTEAIIPADDFFFLSDEGYIISAELVFHDGNFNEIRRETVEFVLE